MAGSAGGMEPTVGAGVILDTGSNETSGARDEGCASWGFLDRQGQVAEVRMFSTGVLSLLYNDRPKHGLLGLLVVTEVAPSPEEVGPGRFLIFCYMKHTEELLCSTETRQAILMKRPTSF